MGKEIRGEVESYQLSKELALVFKEVNSASWTEFGNERYSVSKHNDEVNITKSRSGVELGQRWTQSWTIKIQLTDNTYSGNFHDAGIRLNRDKYEYNKSESVLNGILQHISEVIQQSKQKN